MMFRHPIQKLCVIPGDGDENQLLLAASGSTINCVNLVDGSVTFQWPTQHAESDDEDNNDERTNRPHKRRKIDLNGHGSLSRQQSEASDASLEIVSERKKGERKKSKVIDTKLPYVSHLLTTSDGKYAIAVTAEDKAVRVFKITSKQQLSLISQRSLPKRLCAIHLTKDEQTILAADKFGDVYAIPLHPSEDWAPKPKTKTENEFKPSATSLTVHTKGNLEALRQQQEQKGYNPKKEGPNFEHQILLGHVSTLTDLIVGEGDVNGKARPFILTSDRDEHIRVSRGIPQAHIIENFCLGQKEFVTKLCIPPLRPDFLIAGNGVPSLKVYEWQKGRLLQSIPMYYDPHFVLDDSSYGTGLPEGRTSEKLAISGIWPVNFSKTTDPKGTEESLILSAFEGLPMLTAHVVMPDGLQRCDNIALQGNVLDVAVLEASQQVLVSIDTAHKPYSMTDFQQDKKPRSPFQILKLNTLHTHITINGKFNWEVHDVQFDCSKILDCLPEVPQPPEDKPGSKRQENNFSPLGEFLYGLENLRKKPVSTEEDEEDSDAGEEVLPKPDEDLDV